GCRWWVGMTGTGGGGVSVLVAAALLATLGPDGHRVVAQGSAALPVDVTWILSDNAQFPADKLAALRRGEVIARTETSSNDFEASAIAAVRIATPKQRAVDYFRQLLASGAGQVPLQSGAVSNPPRIEDFSKLTIDRDDFNDLRECRPGRCDVRVGSVAARTLATAIDWRAPDAADRLNAWAREQL